jgi:hypothetical protein
MELTRTRAGGRGAFVGAIVFPILALFFGWIAVRAWRRTRPPLTPLANER